MEESEKSGDLEVKAPSFIDDSSKNDSLVLFPSSFHSTAVSEVPDKTTSFEGSVALGYNKVVNMVKKSGEHEQLPELSATTEPEIMKRIGKCNLRKSLAWDNAFFTSAGVLDPDELSSIIEGAEQGEKCILPTIEEDIRRSADSVSTLDSDSLTMESLEAELFEDIRASIQRSHKASEVANSRRGSTYMGADAQSISSLKKSDPAHRNGMKLKPLLKKQTIGMQGSEKTIKQGFGYAQVRQSAVKIGDSSASLSKPLKATSRINPNSAATTKRNSLSHNRAKLENEVAKDSTAGSNKRTQAPNLLGLGGARRVVPKPASSSKSLSLCSSNGAKKEPAKFSSLHDNSGRKLSSNVGKSSLNPARRKIDSPVPDIPSSVSMPKTPSKVVLNNKSPSSLSAHLMSSKLSSSMSPTSSISECSVESSSSTSTVNQRSNRSKAILEMNSGGSLDSDTPTSDLKTCSNDSCSDQHENEVLVILNQNKNEASTQTRTISRSGFMKPSGLRMPSPKMGFFDGVKSTVRTSTGGVQLPSGLPTSMPKVGSGVCSPSGSSNKAKVGKLARTVTGSANVNSHKSVSPKFLQASSASRSAKKCPSTALKIQDKIGSESCLMPELGIQRPANDLETVLYEEKIGNIGVSETERGLHMLGSANSKDYKILQIEGDTSDSGATIFDNIHRSVDRGLLGHLKQDEDLFLKTVEKKKGPVDDLVDGLSKLEVQKEGARDTVSDVDAPKLFSNKPYIKGLEESFSLDPPSFSLLSTSIQTTASARTPLALKNAFSTTEGIDASKASAVGVVMATTLPSFENGENRGMLQESYQLCSKLY